MDISFFNIGVDGLDGDGFRNDVEVRVFVFFGWVEGGVEESVDECGFVKVGFI